MTKIVATWGRDDFHAGSAVNDAYRSIQAALNVATGNSEAIEIYGGQYKESLYQAPNVNMILKGKGLVICKPPTPTAYFMDYDNRNLTLQNVCLHDFSNTLRVLNFAAGRKGLLENCHIISSARGKLVSNAGTGDFQYPFTLKKSLFVRQDFLGFNLDEVEFCTFHDCYLQTEYSHHGNGYIQNCIITSTHCDFTIEPIIIQHVLFGSNSTFSYDDGVNSVSAVDFATFQAANQTHGWAFDLSNCQVEDEASIYQGASQDNYAVQASCLAVGMASNSGVVGAFKVGNQVLATDSGWQNNVGFSLNGNQYEASAAAVIESPIIDFGINKPIYRMETNQGDAFEDGRLFNHLGQLAAPILSGGTQAGLAIDLVEGAVYSVDGFIEVVTNQRTLTITSQQCFTALSSEQITEVTASGSGEISEVIYLDGHARLLARWWKEGESEPTNWNVVTRDQPVLVDANGKANGELDYDQNAFPRHPVARYLRVKAELSTNNLKS